MAYSALKAALLGLGLGLLAPQPEAARMQLREHSALAGAQVQQEEAEETPAEVLERVSKLFKGGSPSVCGGTQIRQLLSADASIQRIRNLPWSKVMAIADDYLKAQTHKINVLETELVGLRKAAAEAAKAEAPAPLPVEQINAAVTEAVASPATYLSLQLAQDTGCGGVRPKDRSVKLPRDGYDKAEEAFKAAMQTRLAAGNIRVDGGKLHDACRALLFTNPAVTDLSFCGELCHSFANSAQQLSDEQVGGSGGSHAAELQQQVAEKEGQLRAASAELAECSSAKADLQGFQSQLQGLQADIETSFTAVRGARSALNGATQDLEELAEDLEDQTKAVDSLRGVVKDLGDKVTVAQQQLQTLTSKNTDLSGAVKNGEAQLKQASIQVKKAGDAAAAAQSLKAQLSALLMKLSLFFDAALRKPLRDMGLSAGAQSFFPADLANVGAMQDADKALEALRSYCDSSETKAKFADFDALSAAGAGEATASSLCDFGAAPAVKKDILDAVAAHTGKLQEALNGLRAWLDPYKGDEAMSAEKAAQLVEQGEPNGLREMVAVLEATPFFQGYLAHWKISEKFQALYARLGKVMAESQAEEQKLQQLVADLQGKLAEGLKAQQAAADALKKAIEASDAEKANLEMALQELKALQDEHDAMEAKLAKLKQALADAQARYEAAKATLAETHRQGTAFLQVLQYLEAAIAEHGTALVQLHLKVSQ